MWGDYDQIVFADGETLYMDLQDTIVTYEDERIKFVITYDDGCATSYYFEDKLNPNVTVTSDTGYVSGRDGDNDWTAIFSFAYNYNPDIIHYNGMEVTVPLYELSIYYHYGHTENGDFNEIYGTLEERYKMQVKLFMLPANITIVPNV